MSRLSGLKWRTGSMRCSLEVENGFGANQALVKIRRCGEEEYIQGEDFDLSYMGSSNKGQFGDHRRRSGRACPRALPQLGASEFVHQVFAQLADDPARCGLYF